MIMWFWLLYAAQVTTAVPPPSVGVIFAGQLRIRDEAHYQLVRKQVEGARVYIVTPPERGAARSRRRGGRAAAATRRDGATAAMRGSRGGDAGRRGRRT